MGNRLVKNLKGDSDAGEFEESTTISFEYWDITRLESESLYRRDDVSNEEEEEKDEMNDEVSELRDSLVSTDESKSSSSSWSLASDGNVERYGLKLGIKVKRPFETLIAYLSDDEDLFDQVKIDSEFPLDYETMKSKGTFEILGDYSKTHQLIESELVIPLIRGFLEKKIQGYILDDDHRVLLKIRRTLKQDDIIDSFSARSTASILERRRRLEEIEKRLTLPSSHPIQRLHYFSEMASQLNRSKPEFLESSDQLKLAFRTYTPPEKECQAMVIEVAGNSFCFDIAALDVVTHYTIGYTIFDMRGYGHSGGPRGTTPSLEQSLDDIKRIVRHFRLNYPGIPLFLMGASRVAGLILNYSSYKEREPVEGYMFFNPNFGCNARQTFDHDKFEKMKELMNVNVFRTNLLLNCLSEGLLKKNTVGIRINIDDQIYQTNPLYVNEFSSNLMFVMNASNPRKQLADLNVPFGLWIAEEDSMLIPNRVVQLASKARPDLMEVAIVKEAPSHWDHFCWSPKYIGPWVLERIRCATIAPIEHPMKNSIDLASLSLNIDQLSHPVWKDFRKTIQLVADLKVSERESKFFQSFDGTEIAYKEFLPKTGKPVANLAWLRGATDTPLPVLLSENYNIAVYCMDARGFGRSGGESHKIKSKSWMFKDVRSFIRILRYNHPDSPVFLGGHGFHAAVVLNYAGWKKREPVNGYIFVSLTLLNYHNLMKSDTPFVKTDTIRKLVDLNDKCLFCPNWVNINSKLWETPDKMKTLESIKLSRGLFAAYTIRDVETCFANIDVPFGFWCGSADETLNGTLLAEKIKEVSKISFKEVTVLPDATHIGILSQVSDFIGPFISQNTKQLFSVKKLIIDDPKLSDFSDFEQVGKGAFGRVFVAIHKPTGRFVALKVLRKKDLIANDEIPAVIQERDILQNLHFSLIVSYIGSFQDTSHVYIIMEFIVGGELFLHLKYSGKFTNEKAKFYAAELILFFEYLHNLNYVYRDLKPENVLLDSMGHIKVVDFGFAKRIHARTKSFCGTPEYIAPEMLLKLPYDYSVDIWSLGILIYEMLTGFTPYSGHNPKEIYRKILYSKIEFPSFLDPTAKDLLKRLLHPHPEERLGCGKKGLDELKRHKWFKGIDWDRLKKRDIAPPYVPPSSYEGDSRNFLSFHSDITSESESNSESIDQSLFSSF